jgi:predicted dienelactone hydrolase
LATAEAVLASAEAGILAVTHKQYSVKGMDKTSNKVDVWYPKDTSQQYPFISYSHGNTAGGKKTVTDYDTLLSTMASYGYIIAAHESCDTGCSDKATDLLDPPGFKHMYQEQLKVIDWAKETGAGGDQVLSSANFSIGVGISGHSMGGQATMKSASSLHVAGHGIKAAVMHHAYTHIYEAPTVPFLVFTGTADVIALPAQTTRFYELDGANPIKGYVNKKGATHFEPNSLDPAGAKKLGKYSAAWFKVFLDETPQSGGVDFHEMIFGKGPDSLCHGGDGEMEHCSTHDGTPPSCDDIAPDDQYTCEEQAGFGKCDRDWMAGYCCKTCFYCDSSCGQAKDDVVV